MANQGKKGLVEEVHECTSETCRALMHRQGDILRCNLCGNTNTITGWERWKLEASGWHPPKMLPFIPMEFNSNSVLRDLVTV